MKILLVKPLYVFDSRHPLQFTGAEKALPLSLAYIAAVMERNSWEVRVIDYQISPQNLTQVLKEFLPDVLGITAFSKESSHAKLLMQEAKSFAAQMPIIIGGPHANAYQEQIFEQSDFIDYVVPREGEETILELVETLAAGDDPSQVKGIIFRDSGGEIQSTPNRAFIDNLDELPFMALQHFDVGKYHPAAGTFRRLPSVTMITSRGCPYPCTFCNTDLFGRSIRLRSAGNVLDEIEDIVGRYKVREINFCDETLTINRDRIAAICEGILSRNINIGWKCSTRVDRVDKELLSLMKKSGCFFVGFGVESGVQGTLDRLRKGITLDQTREAFKAARETGITTMAYFMMNVPGDSKDDIEESIRFSREIRADFLNFELIKPYAGTQLRKTIEDAKNITINRDMWEKWEAYSAGNHLFYVQEELSEEYLRDAYKRAVKDFYLRPGFILKALLQLRTFTQFYVYVKYFLNMLKVGMINKQDKE